MPNASDRPLRRDAALNRRRILHAAAEVFTARGLGASLDDVARQAGVGVGTVYRRFPDKDTLIEALFEERLGAITGVAERALAEPDSWTALVTFLENASSLMAADRGLREILMYASHGRDRILRAKARLQPVVTALVERAQRDGVLRTDVASTDMPFIQFMLTAAAEYAGDVSPDIWRRYLAIIIDGLRPARAGTSPLPVPAAEPGQMLAIMRSLPR